MVGRRRSALGYSLDSVYFLYFTVCCTRLWCARAASASPQPASLTLVVCGGQILCKWLRI